MIKLNGRYYIFGSHLTGWDPNDNVSPLRFWLSLTSNTNLSSGLQHLNLPFLRLVVLANVCRQRLQHLSLPNNLHPTIPRLSKQPHVPRRPLATRKSPPIFLHLATLNNRRHQSNPQKPRLLDPQPEPPHRRREHNLGCRARRDDVQRPVELQRPTLRRSKASHLQQLCQQKSSGIHRGAK